jgi:hypothetical protein
VSAAFPSPLNPNQSSLAASGAAQKHWTGPVRFGSYPECLKELFALWTTSNNSTQTFFAQAAAVSPLRLH